MLMAKDTEKQNGEDDDIYISGSIYQKRQGL